MFENRISLFKILGFEVWIDLSWLILAVLITWSLAVGYFPVEFSGLSQITYLWMGVAGAMGIFVSIIFHELWHSLVARKFGLPMKGITLFIFGGVAEMTDEPPSATAEFMMAIAGPISSIFLSLGFFGVYLISSRFNFPLPIIGVFFYLGFINGLLAVFNLIPGFPLDGGRILRSLLWAWKKNLRWATNIASNIGSFFGIFLIVMGLFSMIGGNVIGGFWYFLIGLFLRNAANMSYQQVLMKQYLEGESVSRFMNQNPITVPSSISIRDLVEDFYYKYHFKMFPVVEDSKLVGCITIKHVKEVPKSEWEKRSVGEVSTSCSSKNTISSDEDAIKALSIMNQTGESRLMVVNENQLLGLITLKDLLKFLSLKLDLEGVQE
jgi:Zn-dependent protease